MVSTNLSISTPGLPRNPVSSAWPFSDASMARAVWSLTGASRTAVSPSNLTMMPPSPAAISGPNWRSFLMPSTISTPGAPICCTLMPSTIPVGAYRDAEGGEYRVRVRLRQGRTAGHRGGQDGAGRLFGGRRRSSLRFGLPAATMFMPVEPGAQRRKAAIGRAKHAHLWVGIEKFTARSLIPLVHPDHGQRPIGAISRFDNGRRPRAARRGVRKDHRHHQCAKSRVAHEGIEAESESLGCLQHFGGEVGGIGDRAEIRNDLAQRAVRLGLERRQRNAMRFRLDGPRVA